MNVAEILRATGGRLIGGDRHAIIDPRRISTDSRSVRRGDLFVAIKGDRFDGDAFAGDALTRGALGAVVTRDDVVAKAPGKVIIRVDDGTKALQQIAHHHRMRFSLPVIGVTGSNGKTTVKEMIAAVLSGSFKVLKTEGTKNNHIGVPQTLLKLTNAHEVCVLEMGTNHQGEIRFLAQIARPSMGVLTNIGPSHLEFFKDLEGVFSAKRELLDALPAGGCALVNGDDMYLSHVESRDHRIVRFGFRKRNHVRANHIFSAKGRLAFIVNERHPFSLRMLGLHNVMNSLAAIACGLEYGVSYSLMKKRLAAFAPAESRMHVKEVGGIVVIDDSYNANPLSMEYALEALAGYQGKTKWVVVGDMLELGKSEKRYHESVGVAVAKLALGGLFTYGKLSRHIAEKALASGMKNARIRHCATHEEIARALGKAARKGDVVLVKGSRGMRMEEVIKILEDRL